MSRIVDVDEVLSLFGIEDEDFYAKGTIEDALYDGSLKVIEPRKTGTWIKVDKGHGEYTAVCSACGDEWAWSYVKLFSHCPNCGLQMRASKKMMDSDPIIKNRKQANG